MYRHQPVQNALTNGIRAGKCAFLVTKQFGFDQILRDSRHIERDKRRFGSRTVAMQGMSDQFFTGAGFAVNQHANRRTRKPTDNPNTSCMAGASPMISVVGPLS